MYQAIRVVQAPNLKSKELKMNKKNMNKYILKCVNTQRTDQAQCAFIIHINM